MNQRVWAACLTLLLSFTPATVSAADVAAAAAAAKRRARELKRLGDALSAGRCATRWWRAPEA